MVNISECVLEYALANKCIVTIMYMKDTEITQRKIKIVKMGQDNIKAIDLDKNGMRTFKKTNILSAMNES